eukprot:252737-Chlamydomonas_euryale.AAC.1
MLWTALLDPRNSSLHAVALFTLNATPHATCRGTTATLWAQYSMSPGAAAAPSANTCRVACHAARRASCHAAYHAACHALWRASCHA